MFLLWLQCTYFLQRCRLNIAHSQVISSPGEEDTVLTGINDLISLQQLVSLNRNLVCGKHLSTGDNLDAWLAY